MLFDQMALGPFCNSVDPEAQPELENAFSSHAGKEEYWKTGLLVKFLMPSHNSSQGIVGKASCFHSWIVQKSFGHVVGSLSK